MKSVPAKPSTHRRCYHFTPTGRRCRSGIRDEGGLYCPRHTEDLPIRAGDFSDLLTQQAGHFDAQGIHGSLAMLYHVLASGDISPRRAAVLTYMSSLMLRTLPMIEINLQKQCAELKAQIATIVPDAIIKSSIDPASNSIMMDVKSPRPPALHLPSTVPHPALTSAPASPSPAPSHSPSETALLPPGTDSLPATRAEFADQVFDRLKASDVSPIESCRHPAPS